jgi:hypothetical protein
MVTFSAMPYREALRLGTLQDALMAEILEGTGAPVDLETSRVGKTDDEIRSRVERYLTHMGR